MRAWLARQWKRRPARLVASVLVLAIATVWAGSSLAGWADLAVFATRVRMVERTPDTGPRRSAVLEFPYRGSMRRLTVRVADAYASAARELPTTVGVRERGAAADRPRRHAHPGGERQPVRGRPGPRAPVAPQRPRARLRRVRRAHGQGRAVDPLRHAGLADRPAGHRRHSRTAGCAPTSRSCSPRCSFTRATTPPSGCSTASGTRPSASAARAPGFAGTPYSFIETTREAFVNEYDDALVARGTYIRPPQLIQVGGRTRYTARRPGDLHRRHPAAVPRVQREPRAVPALRGARRGPVARHVRGARAGARVRDPAGRVDPGARRRPGARVPHADERALPALRAVARMVRQRPWGMSRTVSPPRQEDAMALEKWLLALGTD